VKSARLERAIISWRRGRSTKLQSTIRLQPRDKFQFIFQPNAKGSWRRIRRFGYRHGPPANDDRICIAEMARGLWCWRQCGGGARSAIAAWREDNSGFQPSGSFAASGPRPMAWAGITPRLWRWSRRSI